MKILITGIAGFVGASIAKTIINNLPDIEIIGIDNFSYGYMDRLTDIIDKIKFYNLDLKHINETITEKSEIDLIIHCAAIAPLPECQVNTYRALDQNVSICGSVADFALLNGIKNIIFFSSAAVYENSDIYPTSESVSIQTNLVYPTTKYLAELFWESISRSYDLNIVSIRLFNLYGPSQDYFRKQPPLIGYLLKSIITNEPAYLYSNGEQSRDYIYINDLYSLIEKIISYMAVKNVGYVVINAGSGNSVSVNGIISKLELISGERLALTRLDSITYWDKYSEFKSNKVKLKDSIISKEVDKYTLADISFANKIFGWSPKCTLEQGLTECYNFAKNLFDKK